MNIFKFLWLMWDKYLPTLFENENEWQKTEPVPIPHIRASKNFPDLKTRKKILVLTSGKFLEALGSGISTGSVFCHSLSFSNNVIYELYSPEMCPWCHWHIQFPLLCCYWYPKVPCYHSRHSSHQLQSKVFIALLLESRKPLLEFWGC